NQFRAVSDLLADDLYAGGLRHVVNAGEVLVCVGGEHGYDRFLASHASALLDHTQNLGVLRRDLPDFIKDEQRQRARTVRLEPAYRTHYSRRDAIGQSLAHVLGEGVETVEFIHVVWRIRGEVGMRRSVEPGMVAILLQSQRQRRGALPHSGRLERVA